MHCHQNQGTISDSCLKPPLTLCKNAATFSIVSQSVALNCFPPVEVVKTSQDISGQVYLPSISWILMLCSIAVTAGFQTTSKIGNAFGEILNESLPMRFQTFWGKAMILMECLGFNDLKV